MEAQLIKGSGAVFDVVVDDALVFSKHQVGRHANPGEVMGMLKSRPS